MYFENGFACRIKLRNIEPYEQFYGPVPVKWRGHNNFFLEINFAAMIPYAYACPSDIVNITLKFSSVAIFVA